jgi:Dolichyl-phosphate-mannose-protein mannosyltransferase
LIVIVFVALFAITATTSMRDKSLTADELTHIVSGYYMLSTGDLSLHSGHPIFVQLLITLPLLTMDLKLPPHNTPFFKPGGYTTLENWKYGYDFLYKANRDKVDQIIFSSRLMVVLLSIILAIYIFVWAKELNGEKAGFFALFLYVFSPNILAHSRLATLEMGITAFTFIAVYYFRKLMFKPRVSHLILAGTFLGLALVSKITSGLLVPVYLLYMILFVKHQPPDASLFANRLPKVLSGRLPSLMTMLFGVLIIAWFVINLCYGFHGVFKPLDVFAGKGSAALAEKLFSATGVSFHRFFSALPVPFPEALIEAFKYQYAHALQGHPTFLMGHYGFKGWWYYHLFAFFIKVPIPVLLLVIVSIVFIIRKFISHEGLSVDDYILLIPIFSLFLLVSLGNIKEGFRHLIPILPFLYVFLSKILTIKWRRKKLVVPVFTLLCGWYLVSSLSIFPHYLAYFNELIGGPKNGYKYLVDCNLDWGQDLKGLKRYMVDNNISKIKLSYFGSGDPSYYGIDYDYLPSIGLKPSEPQAKWWYEKGYQENCEPVHGIIAISPTNLQGVLFGNHDCFNWLKEYDPIEKIGYSMFVYNIPS